MLNQSLTKRHLGILGVLLGGGGFVAILLYEFLGFGNTELGIGPSQKLALAATVLVFLLGLSLLPLKHQAA